MCQHSKYVYNKYINKSVLVSCGKCNACQQEKANARALRIRNHNQTSHNLCLFLTLTYENRFVPYVDTSSLIGIHDYSFNQYDIPVYRDADVRYYDDEKFIFEGRKEIACFSSEDFIPHCDYAPQLNKKPNCTGVVLWQDAKNFMKRLRINLKRKLHYEQKISYFCVGEYGKRTHRPHLHLLVYFPQGSLEELRPIIAQSWPYGDMFRSDKRIQEAVDASGYVASYVNKSASLPKICESSAIRQKHSHSKYFGCNSVAFSLDTILSKLYKHDITYRREVIKDGQPTMVPLPLPKYVVNRYFPRFKGDNAFTTDEILQLLRFPTKLWDKLGHELSEVTISYSDNTRLLPISRVYNISSRFSSLLASELTYSPDDFRLFVNHLKKCVDYYVEQTGKTIYDYAIDYVDIWNTRKSYILMHSYDDVLGWFDFYENIIDYLDNPRIAPTLDSSIFYVINPNDRGFLRRKDKNLIDLFIKKENIKDVNNTILSDLDEEF